MRLLVILLCILITPGECASRLLAQLASSPIAADEQALDAAEQPAGAQEPAGSLPNIKDIISTPDELLSRVRDGTQYLEISAHLDMSNISSVAQDFHIISSGNVYLKGNCPADLTQPAVDYEIKDNQCVLTLGEGGKGLLAALSGAQVVLSNIVVSRTPTGASEPPTISATDSSVFMDAAAIIIAEGSAGAAQGLRLRSSRALLSSVHLSGNSGARGGAIDAIGSSLQINERSLLTVNEATETDGGAVWAAYSTLRMSNSTCIDNSAAGGGGAIALQAPSDAELRNMTITLNDASEMGGAILLDGVLGNNSLSVFGSSAFQGNNAGSTGQDIAVASAGTVTFDSDTNAANVDGAGVGDFAWQPIVSVQPNISRADAFPSFLEAEESWIVEAQQVFDSDNVASSQIAGPPEPAGEDDAPPVCPRGEQDSRVVVILAAISGALLLCTLSLGIAVCILRRALPSEPGLSGRSTTTKTSSMGRGTQQSHRHGQSGAAHDHRTPGGYGDYIDPHAHAASRRAAAMLSHGGDVSTMQQTRGAIDAGPDSTADRALWYGERTTGAATAVPPLRIGGATKGSRSHPWRRMFRRAESTCDSPELNTINEEEEPCSAGIVHMNSPGSGRCAVIMVPSTVSSNSSSSSESEAGTRAHFKTTVTVHREGGSTVRCNSPDSSSIGSSSIDSLSSTLSHDSSGDSASPAVRTHRVQRVLMTDVSPLSNQMDSLESLPGLQRALISEPSGCEQGQAADVRSRPIMVHGHGPLSNTSVHSHDSNVSEGSKQGSRGVAERGPGRTTSGGDTTSGPWSGERPPRPASHRPWAGEKAQQRVASAPIDVDFGMSVIDGLQHRLQSLHSGPLGGPTSSGVLENPQSHVVDSIMRSDAGRSVATDGGIEATSTHCSNTFFLLPPRSISPGTGPHTHPDSHDLQGLTDDLLDKGASPDAQRTGQNLKRMSQELKERGSRNEAKSKAGTKGAKAGRL